MQAALFGHATPAIDASFAGVNRHDLSRGAWVDHAPGWLNGHARAFEELLGAVSWRETTQVLFDQEVSTPRRVAVFPEDGQAPAWLLGAADALSRRYGVRLDRLSANLYRDGADSVAWHRDRGHRDRPRGVVVIISLGEPRRLLLRPRKSPSSRSPCEPPSSDPLRSRPSDPAASRSRSTLPAESSRAFSLGWGDLLVMGGTCQRTWEHSVPKVRRAGPRISVMLRHDPDI